MNLLLVDAHEVVLRGLRDMLTSVERVAEVHAAATYPDALHILRTSPTIDLALVGPAGEAEWAEGVAAIQQHVPVVALVRTSAGCATATKLLVSGFVIVDDATPESLRDAIELIARGQLPMPQQMTHYLLSALRGSSSRSTADLTRLTAREQDVLVLLSQGLSNKAIAQKLGVSVHGAKRHVSNILAKLNSPSRAHAVCVALQTGYLTQA